jgi:hypothetical protein
MKSHSFLNIFTIFNQLYNLHCLHNLCNGKTNIKMALTNDSIAYAYAISSKTQKLSVQPNSMFLMTSLLSQDASVYQTIIRCVLLGSPCRQTRSNTRINTRLSSWWFPYNSAHLMMKHVVEKLKFSSEIACFMQWRYRLNYWRI